jgi:hypothetical protein
MKLPAVDTLFLLLCREGLPEPEREYRPFDGRKFAYDLAYPGARLGIEVDGGTFGRGKRCPACGRCRAGAHSSAKDINRDREMLNLSTLAGWRLLRFTTAEAASGAAVDTIRRALEGTDAD